MIKRAIQTGEGESMRDEFEFPSTCHVFKVDTEDVAGLLERAANWIRSTPGILVQDIVVAIYDEKSSVLVYYIHTTAS